MPTRREFERLARNIWAQPGHTLTLAEVRLLLLRQLAAQRRKASRS